MFQRALADSEAENEPANVKARSLCNGQQDPVMFLLALLQDSIWVLCATTKEPCIFGRFAGTLLS